MDYFLDSSPNLSNNVPNESSAGNAFNATGAVALNKVLRQELNKAKGMMDVHELSIRCDELPVLEGNPSDFETLFQGLISLLLQHPSVATKQLLSIQCKEHPVDKDAAPSADEKKHYIIQFHTNIALEPYWQVTHQNQVKECRQIAARYNGQLIINNLHSGCLFTLHLSAKPL